MHFKALLILAAAVAGSLADTPTLLGIWDEVDKHVINLNGSIATWNGGILTSVPLFASTTKFIKSVDEATVATRAVGPLSEDEAFLFAIKAAKFLENARHALEVTIAAKPKFDKLRVKSTVVTNLKLLKKSAEDLSEGVTSKMPQSLEPVTQVFMKRLIDDIGRVIEAYK